MVSIPKYMLDEVWVLYDLSEIEASMFTFLHSGRVRFRSNANAYDGHHRYFIELYRTMLSKVLMVVIIRTIYGFSRRIKVARRSTSAQCLSPRKLRERAKAFRYNHPG
jgi:hypothetical protein